MKLSVLFRKTVVFSFIAIGAYTFTQAWFDTYSKINTSTFNKNHYVIQAVIGK